MAQAMSNPSAVAGPNCNVVMPFYDGMLILSSDITKYQLARSTSYLHILVCNP